MAELQAVQTGDNRRHCYRHEVALAGSAYGLSRSRSIVVSDLSSQGAQIDGRDLPPPGEDLMMVVGSVDTFAKVVWQRNDRAGIHFEDAISPTAIEQMKHEADWTSVAGWYR